MFKLCKMRGLLPCKTANRRGRKSEDRSRKSVNVNDEVDKEDYANLPEELKLLNA